MSMKLRILDAAAVAIVMVAMLVLGAGQPTAADDVEQRIADFWKRVDALGPADVLTASDLGQWALNVSARDPGAGITAADFRASTAAMQSAFDRAGVGVPPGTPKSTDVEDRIARFWQKVDALGSAELISAADLGQWALNVTDRDPNKRIRVDDFRASTAGMQGGLDRARSLPRPATPTPTVTPRPTPAYIRIPVRPSALRVGESVQLAAEVTDANGNVISGQPVEWSVDTGQEPLYCSCGTVSSGGVFTATKEQPEFWGPTRVYARLGSLQASVLVQVLRSSITPTPTPTLIPTPAPAPPPTGTTITDGQDATVACGTGAARVDATVSGIRPGLNGLIVGDTATIDATAPTGSLLRWVFGGPGTLTIDGCTATYAVTSIGTAYQTSATIRIMRAAAPTPSTVGGGEGGPRLVVIDKTITINVYDPANQPAGSRCGNEYLQVSLSGPYSYSLNTFQINGPGTNYLWSAVYSNARTFQPITPGTYQIAVNWADGEPDTYYATVSSCGYAKVIKSKQGWGVPVR